MRWMHREVTTLHEALQYAARHQPRPDAIGQIQVDEEGQRSITAISYQQLRERCKNFARGLVVLGEERHSRVGIFAMNRLDYAVAEYGCYWNSMTIVPMYSALALSVVGHIVEQCDMTTLVLDTVERAEEVVHQVNLNLTPLKNMVIMDNLDNKLPKVRAFLRKAHDAHLVVHSMDQVEKMGDLCNDADKEDEAERRADYDDDEDGSEPSSSSSGPYRMTSPKYDDVAVVCYTSGTTGLTKGTLLTHGNIISSVSGIAFNFERFRFNKDDTYLAYLPLGHVMERILEVSMLAAGAQIVYSSGRMAGKYG